MKILMQNRYDSFNKKGGDTVQMQKTKECLEKMGVSVDISLALNPNVQDYDIVHLFNITRVHETFIQLKNAKASGKPVVVSTIYHSRNDIRNYEIKNLKGIFGLIARNIENINIVQALKTMFYVSRTPKIWYSLFIQIVNGYQQQQKKVISNSDMILPNSHMELDAIKQEVFDGNPTEIKYKIVANGVDKIVSKMTDRLNEVLAQLENSDFTVCVGRIEPRKNQLKIIEALKDQAIPVIFIGKVNGLHKSYFQDFINLVDNTTHFFYLGELRHEEVMKLFERAKVSILASWFETTGLVGIEAGLCGCNIVMTEKGFTREYYDEKAWFCDPEEPVSILSAVKGAFSSSRNHYDMPEHISNKGLTWKHAAEQTLDAYNMVLNR